MSKSFSGLPFASSDAAVQTNIATVPRADPLALGEPLRARSLLLRQPLFWLFLAVGITLVFAAGVLAGHRHFMVGERGEAAYLQAGFYAVEQRPAGPYRWTRSRASIQLPHAGPGHVTARLTVFDAAPVPRDLRIALDNREIFSGRTHVGGAPYDLSLDAIAETDSPVLTLDTAPWNPPGEQRVLGVAITEVDIVAPDAAQRARLEEAALVLAVLALVVAVAHRTRRAVAVLAAGLGTLSLTGILLAYQDVWLANSAGAFLALSLVAAGMIAIGLPRARGPAALSAPLWGALVLAAALLLLTMGRFNTGDAEGMYQVTAGIAEDGTPWQHQGHQWIKFGLGQPVATLPLYTLGRAWADLAHADPAQLTRFSVALFNQGVVAATALLLFLGARRRFGTGAGLALAGTYLLATPAIAYARLAFAEPLSGLLVLGAALLLWPLGMQPTMDNGRWTMGTRRVHLPSRGAILGAGLLLGFAALVKPANAIYIPVPALYIAWLGFREARAWRRVVAGMAWFAAGLLPGLLLVGAYNILRYGSPLLFGYEREGFTTPLATGLYGLLLSTGKGIVFFAPPVLLAIPALRQFWRSHDPLLKAEMLFIAIQAAIVLIFYAAWSSWEGNIAWGPRLILPVVPLLLWPLGMLWQVRWAGVAWWALGAAGFLVAIPGTLVNMYYYFDINGVYGAGTAAEQKMLFTPAWSQIVAQWRFLLTGAREAITRPTLESMGLPRPWDTALPVAFIAIALAALVLACGRLWAIEESGA